MAIRHFYACDRCGQWSFDVRKDQDHKGEFTTPLGWLITKLVDLCPRCKENFHRFMENK